MDSIKRPIQPFNISLFYFFMKRKTIISLFQSTIKHEICIYIYIFKINAFSNRILGVFVENKEGECIINLCFGSLFNPFR
jgi:hypothetical protein